MQLELFYEGQNDISFAREDGEVHLKDLPQAEMPCPNSGHFAVEDCLPHITEKMIDFATAGQSDSDAGHGWRAESNHDHPEQRGERGERAHTALRNACVGAAWIRLVACQ